MNIVAQVGQITISESLAPIPDNYQDKVKILTSAGWSPITTVTADPPSEGDFPASGLVLRQHMVAMAGWPDERGSAKRDSKPAGWREQNAILHRQIEEKEPTSTARLLQYLCNAQDQECTAFYWDSGDGLLTWGVVCEDGKSGAYTQKRQSDSTPPIDYFAQFGADGVSEEAKTKAANALHEQRLEEDAAPPPHWGKQYEPSERVERWHSLRPLERHGEWAIARRKRDRGQPRLSETEETVTARVPMPASMHEYCMSQPAGLSAYIRSLIDADRKARG